MWETDLKLGLAVYVLLKNTFGIKILISEQKLIEIFLFKRSYRFGYILVRDKRHNKSDDSAKYYYLGKLG